MGRVYPQKKEGPNKNLRTAGRRAPAPSFAFAQQRPTMRGPSAEATGRLPRL